MDYNKQLANREEISDYQNNYSESKFKDKIYAVAKKAGIKVIYAALLLFYALKSDVVPIKDKMLVIGALGYFILPFDFLPDFIPFSGYADDFIALFYALKTIKHQITPEIKQQAKNNVYHIFKQVDEKDFNLF